MKSCLNCSKLIYPWVCYERVWSELSTMTDTKFAALDMKLKIAEVCPMFEERINFNSGLSNLQNRYQRLRRHYARLQA